MRLIILLLIIENFWKIVKFGLTSVSIIIISIAALFNMTINGVILAAAGYLIYVYGFIPLFKWNVRKQKRIDNDLKISRFA